MLWANKEIAMQIPFKVGETVRLAREKPELVADSTWAHLQSNYPKKQWDIVFTVHKTYTDSFGFQRVNLHAPGNLQWVYADAAWFVRADKPQEAEEESPKKGLKNHCYLL